MDAVENKLINYISVATVARSTLSQLKGIEIGSMELQLALCEVLGLSESVELLDKELTSETIISLLKSYSFSKDEFICEIENDESILPPGTPLLLTEQVVKSKGEKWIIHKNDADPFPSTPHAHNYESGYSLHLGTGEFFKKRDSKGFLECKKLIFIRSKLEGYTLPNLDVRCT